MDKHDCYEHCVQSPTELTRFLRAVHADDPKRLAEDFSAAAALSRAWIATDPDATAIATDLDANLLERARSRAAENITRLTPLRRDVLDLTSDDHPPADIVFVGNFSIGEIHDRADLVRYLTAVNSRLAPQGVFLCDTYGGESAYSTGEVRRAHPLPDGRRVMYTWEQRDADPITRRVMNACHFRIERAGMIEEEFDDAFVYDWRLWSIPELIDALTEAGFTTTEVYDKLSTNDETTTWNPIPVDALPESYVTILAARSQDF